MVNDLINWWEVFANAAVSLLVAAIVALYIRFKVKPKHEIVFEHNRNEEIKRIFTTLHFLDFHFKNFIDHIENELGPITRDRETLSPKAEFKTMPDGSQYAEFSIEETRLQRKFYNLQPKIQYDYERMNEIAKSFQKDFPRLLEHIENSFLNDVWMYIFDSKYYAEWATKDYLMNHLFDKIHDSATKIIKFTTVDKTINLNEPYIKEFIEKWK